MWRHPGRRAEFPDSSTRPLPCPVGADGKVTEVKAIGSPGAEMVQYAGAVLILTKFKPAVCSGRPCRMEFPLRQYFGRP